VWHLHRTAFRPVRHFVPGARSPSASPALCAGYDEAGAVQVWVTRHSSLVTHHFEEGIMSATVIHLQLKSAAGAPMRPVSSVEAIAAHGLKDDANAGPGKRQVLIIERELLDEFQLPAGSVRENITVQGIQLAGMAAGTRVRVGRALLEATLDCAPCQFIEDKRPGLRAAMEGKRGTLFRVIEGGEITVGDVVRLV
jgi:MOSC domain-containing protein YiiM